MERGYPEVRPIKFINRSYSWSLASLSIRFILQYFVAIVLTPPLTPPSLPPLPPFSLSLSLSLSFFLSHPIPHNRWVNNQTIAGLSENSADTRRSGGFYKAGDGSGPSDGQDSRNLDSNYLAKDGWYYREWGVGADGTPTSSWEFVKFTSRGMTCRVGVPAFVAFLIQYLHCFYKKKRENLLSAVQTDNTDNPREDCAVQCCSTPRHPLFQ